MTGFCLNLAMAATGASPVESRARGGKYLRTIAGRGMAHSAVRALRGALSAATNRSPERMRRNPIEPNIHEGQAIRGGKAATPFSLRRKNRSCYDFSRIRFSHPP